MERYEDQRYHHTAVPGKCEENFSCGNGGIGGVGLIVPASEPFLDDSDFILRPVSQSYSNTQGPQRWEKHGTNLFDFLNTLPPKNFFRLLLVLGLLSSLLQRL